MATQNFKELVFSNVKVDMETVFPSNNEVISPKEVLHPFSSIRTVHIARYICIYPTSSGILFLGFVLKIRKEDR